MRRQQIVPIVFGLLVVTSTIPLVKATITREYQEDSYNFYGNIRFSYEVKLIIETEENDAWIVGTPYDIDFSVKLNYVNQSIFNYSEGFYLFFHSPSGIHTQTREILQNSTSISLGHTGNLHLRVSNTREERCKLTPSLAYQLYVGGEFFEHGYWWSDEPIYIEVQSSSTSPPFPSELIFVVVPIVVAAVAVGALFAVRRIRKKSPAGP